MASHIRKLNQRRDKTEPEIIKVFEQYGGVVLRGEELDLFVSLFGQWFAVECKSKGGKLTRVQQALVGLPNTYVCYEAADARDVVSLRRNLLTPH